MGVSIKEIVIASYLHDVGKFAQRADRKDLYDKNMEGQLCKPTNDGHYGYQHTVFTFVFLEKYRDILPDDVSALDIRRLASNHHTPSEYDEWLIAQGDRLSSGADRCAVLNDSAYYEDPAKFYEKPLVHILSSISIENQAKNIAYCPLSPLESDAILSTKDKKIDKAKYNELWKKFEDEFSKLKAKNSTDFIYSLDKLLEKYWWCIPSATNSDADISLYQHSKTTAAFASALYEFHKEANSENEEALKNSEEKKFLFLKGDISGIQKYIFDLKTNENSSKLLRAKSYEIAELGENLSKEIVTRFNMSIANVITSAGGNFMVLLPNTKDIKGKIEQLQTEKEEEFLKNFAGKLSVIISDGVEASENDVQQKNAQRLINKIGDNADDCKQKKMQKALIKNGAILNAFYEKLSKNGECKACGVFPAESENELCKHCKELINDGGKLARKELPPYVAPKNEWGEIITFAEIAEKSTGNKKLAMFKADIDNLGLVFSSSLKERMSFSRYADMSHKLHYFFSEYYAYFVKTHGYKDTIYTVFSGGDDLCILGAWDAVMQFAADFHNEIEKLTNNNPSVTLSGGIVLASSSTPVSLIAEMAENELEKSKHRTDKNGHTVKNAITVFGTTVDWETYKKCLADGKKLQEYLENKDTEKKLSTGVVYKMIDFANRAEKVKNGNVGELFRERTWKSNFCYVVVRNVKNESLKKWLLGFGTSPESMIDFRIAVCYALYTQRRS